MLAGSNFEIQVKCMVKRIWKLVPRHIARSNHFIGLKVYN